MRMKLGVMLGRPIGVKTADDVMCPPELKEKVIEQYKWGVPERRMAVNFGVDRGTLTRWLHRWEIKYSPLVAKIDRQREQERANRYKDGDYYVINLTEEQRADLIRKIECDLTVPQIANTMQEYTYEQVYDTILCDDSLNSLYRKHGHLKARKAK